ncbi:MULTISPECIES: cephalosporin hydroxylase family protein [Gammaproteobacteria]|uniref:cephalosporin hydroxylase family protein n=1 Tax=Gammaproteobacteria TaxID=1236 RepID=UPI003A956F06
MSANDEFQAEVQRNIEAAGQDQGLKERSLDWMLEAGGKYRYSYNFSWLGRPIIQYPQDIVAMQELVWTVQPELIVETGIAHGGSLILFASLLELNAICGGPSDARVLGIDIDIRQHNREAIEAHPMFRRIEMIQGSSIAPEVVDQVRWAAQGKRVLVSLDSNHTHDHVLAELEAYAPLVSQGSYCVIFDTVVEDTPDELQAGRSWGKGNSPKSAVREYLLMHPEFHADTRIDDKLLISVAPEGYLKRK